MAWFKMFIKPIVFEAENIDEAHEIASEVLVESDLETTMIEPCKR